MELQTRYKISHANCNSNLANRRKFFDSLLPFLTCVETCPLEASESESQEPGGNQAKIRPLIAKQPATGLGKTTYNSSVLEACVLALQGPCSQPGLERIGAAHHEGLRIALQVVFFIGGVRARARRNVLCSPRPSARRGLALCSKRRVYGGDGPSARPVPRSEEEQRIEIGREAREREGHRS